MVGGSIGAQNLAMSTNSETNLQRTLTRPVAVVTGASGEIGRLLAAALLEHGNRVIAVDRNTSAFNALGQSDGWPQLATDSSWKPSR